MVGGGLHNLHGLHVGPRVALDLPAIKTWIGISAMSRGCLGELLVTAVIIRFSLRWNTCRNEETNKS